MARRLNLLNLPICTSSNHKVWHGAQTQSVQPSHLRFLQPQGLAWLTKLNLPAMCRPHVVRHKPPIHKQDAGPEPSPSHSNSLRRGRPTGNHKRMTWEQI